MLGRAWSGWLGVIVGVLGGLMLLSGVAYGGYHAVDRWDLFGLNRAWTCDTFTSTYDAQVELEHEIHHHDEGSIRNLDPDRNGYACDGWNSKDANGYLARRSDPAAVGGGDGGYQVPGVGGGSDEAPSAGGCDPAYSGQCLDPGSLDYDCEGGSGDGPDYVAGPVEVVGDDHFDLDRDGDGDGWGCTS